MSRAHVLWMQRQRKPAASGDSPPTALTWGGPSYPHISPGRYSAIAVRTQGPEWCRAYQRWSLLVEFELLAEPVQLACFYNMGNNAERCEIKRHSRYFKAWTLANGAPPMKGQSMGPDVFLQNQVFTVEVVDSGNEKKERPKSAEEMYSRVKQIIRVEYTLPLEPQS